ncbi:MAG TPA: hypothetical protein VEV21_10735 [Burkholderiales bacterium]|nr:hypothetical protein [Burkholderiales bacterium]
MTKLAVSLSLLAAATLAACAADPASGPLPPQGAITPQTLAYHPGTGVVQSVAPVPEPITAVAGGSSTTRRPEPAVNSQGQPIRTPLQRVAIKMDQSGDIMYVDTEATDLRPGMRVELTGDRMIKKL